jgi:hypothetical protein
MTQKEKQEAVNMLNDRLNAKWQEIDIIDQRLQTYLHGLCTQPEYHNAYEILGALKFIRLLDTYE